MNNELATAQMINGNTVNNALNPTWNQKIVAKNAGVNTKLRSIIAITSIGVINNLNNQIPGTAKILIKIAINSLNTAMILMATKLNQTKPVNNTFNKPNGANGKIKIVNKNANPIGSNPSN